MKVLTTPFPGPHLSVSKGQPSQTMSVDSRGLGSGKGSCPVYPSASEVGAHGLPSRMCHSGPETGGENMPGIKGGRSSQVTGDSADWNTGTLLLAFQQMC